MRHAVTFLSVVLFPIAALAQDQAGLSPPPPPPAQSDVAQPQAIRFRWGVDGTLGYFLPADAVDFGASGRAGIQLGDWLGLFADVGFTVGFGGGASGTANAGSASLSGVAYYHIAPMAELSLGRFSVAGGPMLAGGGWVQVFASTDGSGNSSAYSIVAGGLMPGLDLRAAYTFGDPQPSGRRSGFTLGLDVKVLLASVSQVNVTTGPGGNAGASVGDHLVGFAPMLMLGYEAK